VLKHLPNKLFTVVYKVMDTDYKESKIIILWVVRLILQIEINMLQ